MLAQKLESMLKEHKDPRALGYVLTGGAITTLLFMLFGFGLLGVPNFGFVTSSQHQRQLRQSYDEGRLSVLVLSCKESIQARSDFETVLFELAKAKDGWEAAEVFKKINAARLISFPNTLLPHIRLAQACAHAAITNPRQ
jgi:energy-converting hydrogenase Eha subunit H